MGRETLNKINHSGFAFFVVFYFTLSPFFSFFLSHSLLLAHSGNICVCDFPFRQCLFDSFHRLGMHSSLSISRDFQLPAFRPQLIYY